MWSSSVIYHLPRHVLGIVLCACVVTLGGCGSGKSQRVALVPVDVTEAIGMVQLSRDVTVSLPSGKTVVLASGSQWRRTGAIVQGDVYRALGGVFTIPLPRQSEASLVAASGKLIGFYLPGDGTYIDLSRPVALPVAQRQ